MSDKLKKQLELRRTGWASLRLGSWRGQANNGPVVRVPELEMDVAGIVCEIYFCFDETFGDRTRDMTGEEDGALCLVRSQVVKPREELVDR